MRYARSIQLTAVEEKIVADLKQTIHKLDRLTAKRNTLLAEAAKHKITGTAIEQLTGMPQATARRLMNAKPAQAGKETG